MQERQTLLLDRVMRGFMLLTIVLAGVVGAAANRGATAADAVRAAGAAGARDAPVAGAGTIIHVPADLPTIAAAIAFATDGDEIVVAPGSYREHLVIEGKTIVLRSSAGAEMTSIDATGLGAPVLRFGSCAALVDGFTVTGGTPSGGGGALPFAGKIAERRVEAGAGAGIAIVDASPVLRRCFIVRNAGGVGAAASCDGGTPIFDQCSFYLNGSGPGTGGVLVQDGSPRFDTCTFVDEGVVWSGGPPVSIGVGCGRVGACCGSGVCVVTTDTACWAAGGRYLGAGTTCDDPRCPPPCPADVSGDGIVNQSDLLLLLAAWGWCVDPGPVDDLRGGDSRLR